MAKGQSEALFGSKRVPLETNGVPLLYPRYQSLEGLKQGAASAKAKSASVAASLAEKAQQLLQDRKHGSGDGSRNTVGPGPNSEHGDGGDDARPLSKEERLAIKRAKRAARQRERPQPAGADAAADGAAASGAGNGGTDTGGDEGAGAAAGVGGSGADNMRSCVAVTAAVKRRSGGANAEEALRMREALGYAEPSGDSCEPSQPLEPSEPPEPEPKRHKKEKRKEKQANSTGERLEPAAAAADAEGRGAEAACGGGDGAGDVVAATAAAALPKGSKSGFSFGFRLAEAQAEAQTQAKLKNILLSDSADKDGFVPRRVFVCGMPHEYDDAMLTEYWSYCGEIESMDLMRFPGTGNFNGTMFVTFATEDGFRSALACNGEACEGRTLRVEKCKAAAAKRAGAAGASRGTPDAAAGDGTKRVEGYNVAYVGNIAYDVTREELAALFRPHGALQVRLHTDKETGKPKGFAHVHFGDAESLDAAMASLNGTELNGRAVKMSYAQPKRT